MPYYPDQHQRRSIRIPGYDYSTPGAYFLTICADRRRCVFGDVVGDQVHLTPAGEIVQQCWASLRERFPEIQLDSSVVMPNHFHATVILVGARFIAPSAGESSTIALRDETSDRTANDISADAARIGAPDRVGAINRAPTEAPGPKLVTLGEVVRTFKAVSARRIRVEADPGFAWQRNYFERVLRNEERLNAARRYIAENPARWALDPERPR